MFNLNPSWCLSIASGVTILTIKILQNAHKLRVNISKDQFCFYMYCTLLAIKI